MKFSLIISNKNYNPKHTLIHKMEKQIFQNYFIGGKQYKVNGDQLLGEGATAKVFKAAPI